MARQDEGEENFGSTSIARKLVRFSLNLSNTLVRITPEKAKQWIGTRFRKEENRAEGVVWETERLEDLRAAVKDFSYLLENEENLFLTYTKYQSTAHNNPSEDMQAAYEKQTAHPYAINAQYLSENKGNKPPVTDVISSRYSEEVMGTAVGAAVAVFDFTADQPDLQYETIVFLVALVRQYSTLLDAAV